MPEPTPDVDLPALQDLLRTMVSPWVTELDLRLLEARRGEAVLALPVARQHQPHRRQLEGGAVVQRQVHAGRRYKSA